MFEYTANDLKTLTPGRAYRERIGMYLSADLQEAIDLGLRELIYNAQDEFIAAPKPNAHVKITIDTETNQITVADNLRGIPCALREDGINSLTASFLIPHSGAKYNDKTAYSSSVGCNGQGQKIVCHTASFLKVEVHREGNIFFQSFHETDEGAVPDDDVKIIGKAVDTGTTITYVPSPKVYGKDTRIDIDTLCEALRELSWFSRGLKIVLNVDGIEEEFLSKNGLQDGLDKQKRVGMPIVYNYSNPECEVELALQWVPKRGNIRGYANNLYVPQGGAFMSGFKASFTKTFNNLAKSNYDGEMIRSKVEGFVSVKVHTPQYSNQAKTALANPEARTATSIAITNALKEYCEKYPKDFEKIVTILSKEQKADEAAEKARDAILNHERKEQTSRKKKILMPEKFKDCEKHGEESTLYIVEGNSALSGLNPGRNVEYDALYAIRGKTKNALKAPLDEVLKNQEVSDILTLLGCGIMEKYDSKKLKYGKVAIASDGDVDGKNIMCLVATLFMVLMPDFIKEGRLCWLKAPLYRVGVGNKRYYAYSIEELNEYKKKYPNAEIGRYKGLGEMRPDDVEESMFHDENRRLESLTIGDFSSAYETLQMLMGKDVSPRRDFLFENVDFSILNR